MWWSFVGCKEGRLKSVRQQTKHAENGDSWIEDDAARHVGQQMKGGTELRCLRSPRSKGHL